MLIAIAILASMSALSWSVFKVMIEINKSLKDICAAIIVYSNNEAAARAPVAGFREEKDVTDVIQ